MDWTDIMLLFAVSAIFGKNPEKNGVQETKGDILEKIKQGLEKKDLTSHDLYEYTQILGMLKTI